MTEIIAYVAIALGYVAVALGVAAMVYRMMPKRKRQSIGQRNFNQWERNNREDFARMVRSRREKEAAWRQSVTTKYDKEKQRREL